ncbi:hypothetical protein D5278_01035 [bacterium 1XD21-13]|nr:hypothetical protein [bacterium 1XD21-13]
MAQATFSPEGLTLCGHVHLATAARVKYPAAFCGGFDLSDVRMDKGQIWKQKKQERLAAPPASL